MAARAVLALVALALAGCGGGEKSSQVRLGSGEALPACAPGVPAPSATATFVADGKAWAIRPDGTDVTCLFDVARAGRFQWGPRGDRALLSRLEVDGLRGAPRREPAAADPTITSWGRPTGKSIVFVGRNGRALLKVHFGRRRFENITPFKGARYLNVVYHPSGRALAFVMRRGGDDSIWISTNTGKEPRRLVWSRTGTRFGAIAFTLDGEQLLYGAQHKDGRAVLHWLELRSGGATTLWNEQKTVIRGIYPGRNRRFVGVTTGSSCRAQRALLEDLDHGRASPLLPRQARPTRVVGWVGRRTLLVAVGGCGRPLELTSVDVRTRAVTRLASGVSAAAARLPEPTPAPALPDVPKVPGSGFA